MSDFRSDVPVLQVDGLVKHFAVSRGLIRRRIVGLALTRAGVQPAWVLLARDPRFKGDGVGQVCGKGRGQ